MRFRNILVAVILIIGMQAFFLPSVFARRVRDNTPKVYSYITLSQAIEKGRQLIIPDGKEGDLIRLNDILANYHGRGAFFCLARDIEKAIAEGYINMGPYITKISMANFSSVFSREFKARIGDVKQNISLALYFELKGKIEENPDRYAGDDGQILLARETGINYIRSLYSAFGNQYGWTSIDITLKNLDRIIKIFKTNPDKYRGNSGQIQLARDSGINNLISIFSIRNILPDYKDWDKEDGWTQLNITLGNLEKVKSQFLSNPAKYRGNSGQIRLARDSGVSLISAIFTIRNELGGYTSWGEEDNWTELNITLGDLDKVKKQFSSNPDKYRGNNGQIRLARDSGINLISGVFAIRNELEEYNAWGEEDRWTRLPLSLLDFDRIKAIFESNPDKYRGNSGQIQLARDSGVSLISTVFAIRNELTNYNTWDEKSIWIEIKVTLDKLDFLLACFPNNGLYLGRAGLEFLAEETRIEAECIYSIRYILPGYSDIEYCWGNGNGK
ncbi:MAG: hypothetical protein NTZ48_05720 [Candidatus Omnitrophica bacterium]|nr:hypothetical protein [Candidatus Omnitrophota bacterium]